MNEEYKPINRGNIDAAITKLKRVLNPTIIEDSGELGIKIITDINPLSNDNIVSFTIKCLVNDSNTEKTIISVGYIDLLLHFCVSNLGNSRFAKACTISTEGNTLGFILVITEGEELTFLKTEAEVFITDDNKNHIISLSYVTPEDYAQYQSSLQTIEEASLNFSFSFNTGTETIRIANGVNVENTLDTIKYSTLADSLSDDISITINNDNSNASITGSGSINGSTLEGNINLEIDESEIVDDVKNAILEDFPVASSSQVGGVALAGNTYVFNTPQFPVKITELESQPYAYVDLSTFNPSGLDVHRYADMTQAPKNSGFIVQYIGQTDNTYVRGYFYLFTPTAFNITNEVSPDWTYTYDKSTTALAIANYNINVDYLINSGELNFVTQETSAVTSNTVYTIVLNGATLAELTYGKIVNTFKISLNPNVTPDDFNLQFVLEIPTGEYAWKLKNVQPLLKAGHVLVYKGTITANQGETDEEALNRLIPVSAREIGDFYIVKPSNQEYCWIDGDNVTPHWEFMGDIFNPYTEGDGISITSNHDISVKYDNSTIKKNGSGNLYVDGELTDTLADWNESDITSPAYINNKPTIPTVNDATYSVKTDISGTETTVSDFTANQSTADSVTFVQGTNITLTPDATNKKITIAATDTNTTYTFAEGTTDGAFQVTPSEGSALTVDVHNVLKLSGGTLTGQVYFNTTGLPVSTSTVSYSRKYNWLTIATDTTLTIDDTTNLPSMCEVIYAIRNIALSSVVLTLPTSITSVSNGEVYNMIGVNSFTIPTGKLVELVFTFWSPTVVSFNGGASL